MGLASFALALLLFAGSVPVAGAQERPGGVAPPSSEPPVSGRPADRTAPVAPPPPPAPDFEATVATSIERFKPAYARQGSPRIAVYWNRQLTDRLSQWMTAERSVHTGRVSAEAQKKGERDSSATLGATGEGARYQQRLERDALRPGPDEQWGWEFQDGFLHPLLQAGAKVVDRAAIVRIAAAKSGSGLAVLDEQTIEVNALHGYADLLVEILVSSAPSLPTGWQMNAVVKDVNNGMILAHVNGRRVMAGQTTMSWVATDKGFERRAQPPDLRQVATALALEVMNTLAARWQR